MSMLASKGADLGERTLFLSGVTFLGGFLDAYTYITRGGVFANNHTANMAKLGITLGNADWVGALNCAIPIAACVLGAALSEWLRCRRGEDRDWRKAALLAECCALMAVGFLPRSVPAWIVNTALSGITGFQLCLFRKSKWGAHNTTICTGNLRTLGQFAFSAVHERSPDARTRFIQYGLLVFSFVLGSAAGVPVCGWIGPAAAFFGGLSAAGLLFWMDRAEKKAIKMRG